MKHKLSETIKLSEVVKVTSALGFRPTSIKSIMIEFLVAKLDSGLAPNEISGREYFEGVEYKYHCIVNSTKNVKHRIKFFFEDYENFQTRRDAHRRNNPELYNNYKLARSTAENSEDFSDYERKAVIEIFKACRRISMVTGIPQHVDHIISIAKNGSSHYSNLMIVPASENLRKGTKDIVLSGKVWDPNTNSIIDSDPNIHKGSYSKNLIVQPIVELFA